MTIWTKIWRWGLVALFGIGALCTAFLFLFSRERRAFDAADAVLREIESISAEEDAAIAEAKYGKEAALTQVETQYQEALQRMERESAERVAKLRKDPRKLARVLARKGRPVS